MESKPLRREFIYIGEYVARFGGMWLALHRQQIVDGYCDDVNRRRREATVSGERLRRSPA